eukprot:gene9763-1965_t
MQLSVKDINQLSALMQWNTVSAKSSNKGKQTGAPAHFCADTALHRQSFEIRVQMRTTADSGSGSGEWAALGCTGLHWVHWVQWL